MKRWISRLVVLLLVGVGDGVAAMKHCVCDMHKLIIGGTLVYRMCCARSYILTFSMILNVHLIFLLQKPATLVYRSDIYCISLPIL